MSQEAPAREFPRFEAFVRGSGIAPTTAIVTGSGLGGLAHAVELVARARLTDLLGVEAPAVAGHAHEVVVGRRRGIPLLMMLGRFHLYQGLTARAVTAPIRALAEAGVTQLILLNAAGGLNPAYRVGDLMLIDDHINLPGLAGVSSLIPPRDQVEFVPMRDAYSPRLRLLATGAAGTAGVGLRNGVYVMVVGPSYETAAELRMLRSLGADAVGMSTVSDVVQARALGVEVMAVSVITNRAVPDEESTPSHDEVLAAGQQAVVRLDRMFDVLLPEIARLP